MRPGGRRRQQLLDGLGLAAWSDLLRRCDRRSATRTAACALFWTLGGSQVGKAAIAGWRDLLAPALRDGLDLALWPFQGTPRRAAGAPPLRRSPRPIRARSTAISALDAAAAWRQAQQAARRATRRRLLARRDGSASTADPAARAEIEDGFGAGADGEDRFDAVVGLLGMLNVVLGRRASGEPDDPVVRRIEGWILGQSRLSLRPTSRASRPRCRPSARARARELRRLGLRRAAACRGRSGASSAGGMKRERGAVT